MQWSPLSIRSLLGWYAARRTDVLFKNSNGTGAVTTTGDRVEYFGDLSANGKHATQATALAAPTYSSTAFGGLPGIVYAGGQSLITPAMFTAAHERALTLIIVGKYSTLGSAPLAASSNLFFFQHAGGYEEWFAFGGDQNNQQAAAANVAEISAFTYDGESARMYNARPTSRRDRGAGVAQVCGVALAHATNLGVTGGTLSIGSYVDGGSNITGVIAEVIAVGRSMGGGEMADVMGYLGETNAVANTTQIVFGGDSITDGKTTPGDDTTLAANNYAEIVLASLATNGYSVNGYRESYPGRNTGDWLIEFNLQVRPFLWRGMTARNIVLLAFGANDLINLGGADNMILRVREMCARVAESGAVPVPTTVLNRGDVPSFDAIRIDYNTKLRAREGIDFPKLIDWAATATGASSAVNNTTLFKTDTIHPTPAGNVALATAATPVISGLIDARTNVINISGNIAPAADVRAGVRSGSNVGTAILTGADVWTYPNRTLTISTGDVAVTHDTGGTDNLRAEVAGAGISGVVVRAYLQADFSANPRVAAIAGMSSTGSDGRWIKPMYLAPGTYAFTFEGGGINWPDKESVVVA